MSEPRSVSEDDRGYGFAYARWMTLMRPGVIAPYHLLWRSMQLKELAK